MHLIPRVNVMLDFIERCKSSLEEHGTSEHYKNLVHGRIRTPKTPRPPDYKSTAFTTWQVYLGFNPGVGNCPVITYAHLNQLDWVA